MTPLENDAVNPELLDLSMHSHDVRNRIATIKSSAELLMKEDLPPDQRELVSIILERAWSAIDLEAGFSLEKSLRAGLYRPFKKDHELVELVKSALVTLRESAGPDFAIARPVDLKIRNHSACWHGDESLLLLILREMARILTSTYGPAPLRLSLELREETVRWKIDALSSLPDVPVDGRFKLARTFATALGGRITRTGPGLVLSVHDVFLRTEERGQLEASFPAGGR
jgi:hypothetical protein